MGQSGQDIGNYTDREVNAMSYHMTSFFAGFLLDLFLGDPYFLPHPVRWMGSVISKMEECLLGSGKRDEARELFMGILLVFCVLAVTLFFSAFILMFAYFFHPYAGWIVETVMTYQILAVKCLKTESMKVCHALRAKETEKAREAVSMIVGRDTSCLTEEGIARAAVETVAENTSDGVIAPMLYLAAGGPILGFLYKAINTMDSMVGYKNDRYLYFGRAAARLDDAVNFLPARISAYLMIMASFSGDKNMSGRRAAFIYKRDRQKHASPNSAQTEAVCAGALGIRLGGSSRYFGKTVEKPYIGDPLRPVECEDIRRVNRLMYQTAWAGEIVCLLMMGAVWMLCQM